MRKNSFVWWFFKVDKILSDDVKANFGSPALIETDARSQCLDVVLRWCKNGIKFVLFICPVQSCYVNSSFAWFSSFIFVTLSEFSFFQIESIRLKCSSCNHSFTIKFNGDDVNGNESSETIFQLTTLTLCPSSVKNGDYVLTIFHYLYAWFTCPTSSIIMKFKANILIQLD